MLTVEENERLTRVGPSTPMGELLRRYWHPVAAVAQMQENPTKEVRILGEDLVLYKDRSGMYGLVDRYCAHRRVNLAYGIPKARGLRCMYHGWLYDETGQCIEQPFEETVRPDARFKDKVKLKGYPVQELAGLLFAYLGPQPAPLLPRWDIFTWNNVIREIGSTQLPCNWLQCMENSADPVHTEWLHGRFFAHVLERMSLDEERPLYWKKHVKIGFDPFEYGFIKRRVTEGQTEEDDDWKMGHPVLFPNVLRLGGAGVYEHHYRVPMDDHNTMHWAYEVFAPDVEVPRQERIPYYDIPLRFDDGRLVDDTIDAQDNLAWVIQGSVMDRSQEHLGESDRGLILYRRMLQEQMQIVEDGGEPMCVIRDPGKNIVLTLPTEENKMGAGRKFSRTVFAATHARYSPNATQIEALFDEAAAEVRAL